MRPPTVRICGLDLAFRRGSEKDNPDLSDCHGYYDGTEHTIWIHDNVPNNAVPFWTTHEKLHGLLDLSGALHVTAGIFGISPEDPRMEAWEEAIVRVLTPHIANTFGGPR
jgi:hypothetical protein